MHEDCSSSVVKYLMFLKKTLLLRHHIRVNTDTIEVLIGKHNISGVVN